MDESLTARGGALTSAVMASHVGASALPGIDGAFATASLLSRHWPESAPLGDPLEPELIERCLAFERVYCSKEPYLEPLVEHGARAMRWLFESAVDSMRPSACAIINGDSTGAMIAERVCRERGVDVVFWERGAFAGTITLDAIGAEGRGPCALTEDPAWRSRLSAAPTEEELDACERLRAWLLATRRENWSVATRESRLRGGEIVCLPSFETSFRAEDVAARWYADSFEATRALVEAAGDRRVVVKPHPKDPMSDRYASLAREGAAMMDGIGVFDAAAADAIIATTSASVAWMAAALGARVVALRAVPLCVSGAAYSASPDLEAAIDDALARRDWRRRRLMGQAAALRYLRGYCFSADPELRTLGAQDAQAAVDRLIRSAGSGRGVDAWHERLSAAGLARA